MGVDSGLPDFRGTEGFWRAYPALRRVGKSFVDIANPRAFRENPGEAWAFYGHRLNLYRSVMPHEGFGVLARHSRRLPAGAFVFTSNVDGHFQRSGFTETGIFECHGSIHHLQCTVPCSPLVWSAQSLEIEVDEEAFTACGNLPLCPRCGSLARPNILMFGDDRWVPARSDAQEGRFDSWIRPFGEMRRKLVVLEMGAGLAIPTVRLAAERASRALGALLIRINPRDFEGPPGTIGIPLPAREALEELMRGFG